MPVTQSSVMSRVKRLFFHILMGKITIKIRPETPEQFGFLARERTRNVIISLWMLMDTSLVDRSIQIQRRLYLCYIDYSTAFTKGNTKTISTLCMKQVMVGLVCPLTTNI